MVSPVRLALTSQPAGPTAATDRVTSWAVSLLNTSSNEKDASAAPVRAGVEVVRLMSPAASASTRTLTVRTSAAPPPRPVTRMSVVPAAASAGTSTSRRTAAVDVRRDGDAVDDVAAADAGWPIQPSGHAGQRQGDVRGPDRGDRQVEADAGAGSDGDRGERRRDLEAVVGGDGAGEEAQQDGRGDHERDAARARRTTLVGKGTTLLVPVEADRRWRESWCHATRSARNRTSNGRNLPHPIDVGNPGTVAVRSRFLYPNE